MDNRSAFNVDKYDENVRRVIPFYDEIHRQVISLIRACFGDRQLVVLDTGCGTGTFAAKAFEGLQIAEMTLCDPSETMLTASKEKLKGFKATPHKECLTS